MDRSGPPQQDAEEANHPLAQRKFQSLIETISESLSLREIIQRLTDGVVKDLGYPGCYVNLYHPEEDNLSIVGFSPRGKLLDMAERLLKLRVDQMRFPFKVEKDSKYARIFRGEQFVIKDYSDLVSPYIPDSVAYAAQKVFGIKSILVAPLMSKGELLGVFLVGNGQIDFSSEERETLTIVTRHAAIAMEKALLHEALDRAKREAEAMAEIAQDLSTSLDLRRTLRKIVRHARTLCQSDLSWIALYHKELGFARVTEYEGARTDVLKDMIVHPGKGIGGKVLENGRVWLTDDYLRDPRLTRDFEREARTEGIRCNMAVPILSQQEISGILWVANRTLSPFSPHHQRILQKLANQAGIAILNAQLYEGSRAALHRERSLVEIITAINASLDHKEILSTIARFATEFCHGDAAAIYGLSGEGYLILQAEHNISPLFIKAWEESQILPEEAAVSKTIISAFPVEIYDPSTEPDFPPKVAALLKKEGLRSFITMALSKGKKDMGALAVFRRQRQHFSSEELNLLNILTQHTAVALEKNSLYREMESRTTRLSLLTEIAKAISTSLDSKEIFHSMLTEMDRIIPCQRAILYLFNPERDSFNLECLYHKPPHQDLERSEVPASETPASIAHFAKKPFLVKDTQETELAEVHEMKELIALGIHSVLYLPILGDDTCLGVLGLGSLESPGFREDQIELLHALSPHLALALKNAQLYSELKKTFVELEKTQEQVLQAEKLKALGEMASGIAHDFNNLLATILMRAELLENRIADPELKEWTRIIQRTSLDGAETVRRLRSFYKRDEELEKELLDLNQIIKEVIHRSEPKWKDQAQGKGINIEIETNLHPLNPIMGNAAELREVFTNIIFNAIDALPSGGKISLSTRMQDRGLPWEAVEMEVTDNGIGMSEEVLERAFDPFFTTKGPSGSGLGLSVSYGIIRRHQGEIKIHSQPNQGTSIIIRLPSTSALAMEIGDSRPEMDLPPMRILVIEDERELAEALHQILSLFGHRVELALGGREGLCRSAEEEYDLIFTDLGMPDLSGLEVAQSIKSRNPSLPILLVTGWGDQVDPSQVKHLGIDGVVAKPFRITDIVRAIREVIAHRSP